jgi:hypothetical protein
MNPVPTIIDFSPKQFAPDALSRDVTVKGTGFSDATKVRIGEADRPKTLKSATELIFTLDPSDMRAGTQLSLTLFNPTPGGGTSSPPRVIFITGRPGQALPSITSVDPNRGPVEGHQKVTIAGANFDGASILTFGSNPAEFKVDNGGQLTASTPPAKEPGTVHVIVQTAAGSSAQTNADQYTYTASRPPPTIKSVSPDSGSVEGRQTVRIAGTDFTGASNLKFGNDEAQFKIDRDDQLTATTPSAKQPGTVHVTVQTAAGTSAETNADQYTYTS